MTDLELLTKFRRDLHRIPELSFDLPETCAYVRNVLESLSCEVTTPCESCVAAFFDVDAACGREPGGPATAIRADMDALPITENSGDKFKWQLVTVHGEKMKSGKGHGSVDVDVTDVPDGLYIVNVKSKSGSSSEKIIKY